MLHFVAFCGIAVGRGSPLVADPILTDPPRRFLANSDHTSAGYSRYTLISANPRFSRGFSRFFRERCTSDGEVRSNYSGRKMAENHDKHADFGHFGQITHRYGAKCYNIEVGPRHAGKGDFDDRFSSCSMGFSWIFMGLTLTAGQGGPREPDRPRPAGGPRPHRRRGPQRAMVDEEIVAAGVKNPRVIAAMRATPRHEFVPRQPVAQRLLRHGPADRRRADDLAAVHRGLHDRGHRSAAQRTRCWKSAPAAATRRPCLSGLVQEVYTIEIVESLGKRAAKTLKRLNYDNVHAKVGDGYLGWPEHAPFDKIIVTCSPEKVPQALVDQLKEGGRIVIPVGERYQQTLYLLKKTDGKMVSEALLPTIFVPMTGKAEESREVKPDPKNPTLRQRRFRGGHRRSAAGGRLALPAADGSRRGRRRAVGQALHPLPQRRAGPRRPGPAGLRRRRPLCPPIGTLGPRPLSRRPGRPDRAATAAAGRHVLRREPRHDRREDARPLARQQRLEDRSQERSTCPSAPARRSFASACSGPRAKCRWTTCG